MLQVTMANRIIRRMLATGMALALFFPVIAGADGFRMQESCKRPNRDLVISYVSGALERADMDIDTIVTALESALEGGDTEKSGLKKAWVIVRKYCNPGGDVAYQAADIFCNYLLLNPAERKKAAIDTLNTSLQKAWPCPQLSGTSR